MGKEVAMHKRLGEGFGVDRDSGRDELAYNLIKDIKQGLGIGSSPFYAKCRGAPGGNMREILEGFQEELGKGHGYRERAGERALQAADAAIKAPMGSVSCIWGTQATQSDCRWEIGRKGRLGLLWGPLMPGWDDRDSDIHCDPRLC